MYTHINMIRTQIYLDEQLRKDLTLIARQEKESMAEVARNILKEGIKRRKKTDMSGKAILRDLLIIKAKGGPKDLSKNIDYYLYGSQKK